jgi:aryl-alcohol dehydrogenase-like predicted oxidoreductase
MRYRSLGRTGLSVSEIGLGTYTLSGAVFTKGSYWEGPMAYGHVTAEEAKATVLRGLELGLNFIDTAPNYGQAEAVIGESVQYAIRNTQFAIRNPLVIIETKAGEYIAPNDVLTRDFSEANIRRSVAESKRQLRVDAIDVLLLHSPTPEEFGNGEPLDALCRLRDEGEVHFIGVSVGGGTDEAVMLIRSGKVDVLQVDFNLLRPQMADEVFPLAQSESIGIVVRQPLASGFLTGRIREDHEFAADDYRSMSSREHIARAARRAREFEPFVVAASAANMPELALRYILSFDAVSTIIAGAMNREELERNVAVSDKGALSREVMEGIQAVQERQRMVT